MSSSPTENPVTGVVTFTARGTAALDQLAEDLVAECDGSPASIAELFDGYWKPTSRTWPNPSVRQRDRIAICLAATSAKSDRPRGALTRRHVGDWGRARLALPVHGHAALTSAGDLPPRHTRRYTRRLCNRMLGRSLMLPNPYAPGELPRVLAGREQQQDRIRGYLSRIGTCGEMGGPLLVFQGPRGVGKTSLLREAQRDAEEHGFMTAWVACRRNAPFLPDLVSRVGKAIETADILPRTEKGSWRLRLESIGLEFGLPSGVKVSATAAADRSGAEAHPHGARISAMEDLLHETSSQVRARGGAGLVAFVDELHAAARDDLAVLLNAMQNLAGRREDNPLAIMGAGLPSTPGVLVNAATFGERSTFLTLPRLDPAAAATAVAEPATELGVTWTPAALQAIADEAQGFPYLLQALAHAT